MTVDRHINIKVSKCTEGAYFHTSNASVITVIITPRGVCF